MIDAATATLTGTQGRAELAPIETVGVGPGSVDLITARLSLHYSAGVAISSGRRLHPQARRRPER